jgi:hypothetical protein
MATINNIIVPNPAPVVTFDITPHGPPVAIATSFASYSYPAVVVNAATVVAASFHHLTNVNLTFTATVVDPLGGSVLEYYWDFGDGSTGTGAAPTHTFKYPNISSDVHLRVTTTDYRIGHASMNPMLIGSLGGIGYSYLSLPFYYASYTSMDAAFATYDALLAG